MILEKKQGRLFIQLRGLRRVRKARGLTQAQLAEGSGVSTVSISHLERGDKPARQSTAERLARVLFVPVKEIAEESGYITEEIAEEYAKAKELELV